MHTISYSCQGIYVNIHKFNKRIFEYIGQAINVSKEYINIFVRVKLDEYLQIWIYS